MPTTWPKQKQEALIGTLLAALLVSALASPADARIQTQRIDRGHFVLSDSGRPPPDSHPGWEPIQLPDRWDHTRPGVRGNGWYRFELERPADLETPLALYLPHFNMNTAVWLNGEFASECGSFDAPIGHCWNRPLFLALAPSMLDRERNVVHVRLFIFDREGKLDWMYFGPRSELQSNYDRRYFVQIRLPKLFTAVVIVAALFMLAFWVSSRDTVYLYFAGFVACWSISTMNNYVTDIPVSHYTWRWLIGVGYHFMPFFLFGLTHRLARVRRPMLERAVLAITILATLVLAMLPRETYDVVIAPIHGLTVAVSLYAIWVLFVGLQGAPALQLTVLLLSLTTVGLALHDVLVVFGALGRDNLRFFPLAAPVVTLLVTGILTTRFMRAFERARNLNIELERRVQEKHAELEENFEHMRVLEKERVLAEERSRLMRDVHDGIGGTLVSTLAMVQNDRASSEQVAAALRSSLEDLRIVIDSLDPMIDDLNTLLGIVRGRTEPRIRQQGLRFDWQVSDIPVLSRFGPPEYLQILRIVQEAITNVVKHAEANVITVRTGVREWAGTGEVVLVEILDDGVGIGDVSRVGRGRRNMQERARRVGATLIVRDTGRGTRVELWIPVEAAAGHEERRTAARASTR